jgi:hypothetical protein
MLLLPLRVRILREKIFPKCREFLEMILPIKELMKLGTLYITDVQVHLDEENEPEVRVTAHTVQHKLYQLTSSLSHAQKHILCVYGATDRKLPNIGPLINEHFHPLFYELYPPTPDMPFFLESVLLLRRASFFLLSRLCPIPDLQNLILEFNALL